MWLVVVAVYTALAVSLHALLRRIAHRINSVAVFVLIGGAVGIGLVVYLVVVDLPTSELWAVLVLYALACELYTFLFTLVMTSVSAGLLLTLRTGSIIETELTEHSDPDEVARVRIERLVTGGLLREDGGNLTPTAKGRRLVWVFAILATIFRHHPPITSG
jgi:hypothetical protein